MKVQYPRAGEASPPTSPAGPARPAAAGGGAQPGRRGLLADLPTRVMAEFDYRQEATAQTASRRVPRDPDSRCPPSSPVPTGFWSPAGSRDAAGQGRSQRHRAGPRGGGAACGPVPAVDPAACRAAAGDPHPATSGSCPTAGSQCSIRLEPPDAARLAPASGCSAARRTRPRPGRAVRDREGHRTGRRRRRHPDSPGAARPAVGPPAPGDLHLHSGLVRAQTARSPTPAPRSHARSANSAFSSGTCSFNGSPRVPPECSACRGHRAGPARGRDLAALKRVHPRLLLVHEADFVAGATGQRLRESSSTPPRTANPRTPEGPAGTRTHPNMGRSRICHEVFDPDVLHHNGGPRGIEPRPRIKVRCSPSELEARDMGASARSPDFPATTTVWFAALDRAQYAAPPGSGPGARRTDCWAMPRRRTLFP